MKIIFAGTPVFAAVALSALHQAGHEIALVLTQPDRPAGRGLQPMTSAVKRLAQELALPVAQPATLRDAAAAAEIARIVPQAIVVAAYGLIVPPNVLAIPPLGCLNIHASLLPRWRGAAPIQRALLAGDSATGISIMQMDAGLDTGPVLLQEAIAIAPEDTAQTLHDRLAALGGRLIVRALDDPAQPSPQEETSAAYAAKIDKREARIDWREPAGTIERKVRAFNPVPGAATSHGNAIMKIWRARIAADAGSTPGTVCELNREGITIACGRGTALTVLELQRAGGRRLSAAAFLPGCDVRAGDRFGDA